MKLVSWSAAGLLVVILGVKELIFHSRALRLLLNGLALVGVFLTLEAFRKTMIASLLEHLSRF